MKDDPPLRVCLMLSGRASVKGQDVYCRAKLGGHPSSFILHPSMRTGVAVFAMALCSAAIAQMARYPVKPVRIVVPFAPGSPIEVPARAVGQRMAETLGQQFLIDSRPGASGIIGTEIVAKSPRDGYTLLAQNCSHAANPSLFRKLPYDTLADFAPVAQINRTYGNILVAHPSIPARSVKQFIALAKSMPGKLNYASGGVGSPPHVTAALFAAEAGINLTHVAYKGTATAFPDLLSGYVEVMFISPTFSHAHIQAGRIRAMGIAGPRRIPLLPDVPTFDESGLPGFELTCWHGLWAPAGAPADVVRRLHAEVVKAVGLPAVRDELERQALIPVGSSSEEFGAFLQKEVARYGVIAKKIGLQPQ
jgi:tripartite-type tricarboxylate transporter receptor subunit TctC